MALLNRDAILQADDLPTKTVDVPEWGGAVCVRSMTGVERDQYESTMVERKGKDVQVNLKNIRAKLVALCCIGDDGKRLFGEDDAEALGKKSAAALDRVFSVAQKLNGLSAKDVEELAGE